MDGRTSGLCPDAAVALRRASGGPSAAGALRSPPSRRACRQPQAAPARRAPSPRRGASPRIAPDALPPPPPVRPERHSAGQRRTLPLVAEPVALPPPPPRPRSVDLPGPPGPPVRRSQPQRTFEAERPVAPHAPLRHGTPPLDVAQARRYARPGSLGDSIRAPSAESPRVHQDAWTNIPAQAWPETREARPRHSNGAVPQQQQQQQQRRSEPVMVRSPEPRMPRDVAVKRERDPYDRDFDREFVPEPHGRYEAGAGPTGRQQQRDVVYVRDEPRQVAWEGRDVAPPPELQGRAGA